MEIARNHGSGSLWVFGYGSLCWNPGFQFDDSVTGFVRGFARKFWQGNTTHRGVEGKPGRVATLVEEKESVVWGRAFQVSGDAALPYLNTRECVMGGYLTRFSMFHPRDPDGGRTSKPFPALVYVAVPDNALWLGDAPLVDIAKQIVSSSGPSGHNVEYLLRLAEFMREAVPEAEDSHLFALESLVRSRVEEEKMCLQSLMGEARKTVPDREPDLEPEPEPEPDAHPVRTDSFEFTSRVPPKKLRCLNI